MKRLTSLNVPRAIILGAAAIFGVLLAGAMVGGRAETQVSGQVEGAWALNGSPYVVVGGLSIAVGDSLQIQPGVSVIFSGRYGFDVYGTLVAVGDSTDSIHFESYNHQKDDWRSIKLSGSSAKGSRLTYCVVTDANRGLELVSCNATISQSRFSNHLSAGVFMDGGQPAVTGCIISAISDQGSGVRIVNSSRATVSACTLAVCDNYGINVSGSATPTIKDNYITQSGGNAINLNGAGAGSITGNMIMNGNDQGIHIEQSGNQSVSRNVIYRSTNVALWLYRSNDCDLINNTIYESGNKGIQSYATGGRIIDNLTALSRDEGIFAQNAAPLVTNNDSWGNGGNDYSGVEIDTSDISADPQLVNPSEQDFHPAPGSPLIDAGRPPYVDPDGTVADIGAWYLNQNHPPYFSDWTPADSIVTLDGGGVLEFTVAGHDSDLQQLWFYWYLDDHLEAQQTDHWSHDFQVDGEYIVRIKLDDRYIYGTAEHSWAIHVRGAGVKDDDAPLPGRFALQGPYPNPFNQSSVIRYQLSVPEPVNLSLYDISGRLVRILVNSRQGAGEHRVAINGAGLATGAYVISADVGRERVTRKLFLIR